jgi:hypothetical protein
LGQCLAYVIGVHHAGLQFQLDHRARAVAAVDAAMIGKGYFAAAVTPRTLAETRPVSI